MEIKKGSKVVIVNSFIAWKNRLEMLVRYFEELGCEVTVIHSNFDHMKKIPFSIDDNRYHMISAKKYRKNLSVARLWSHMDFAKKALKEVSKGNYDLIYIFAPPNSLIKESAKYKEKYGRNKTLIVDLIDMWPESIPLKWFKKNLFFTTWRSYRDRYINRADIILTECTYYLDLLERIIDQKKHHTLYWAQGCTKSDNDTIDPSNHIQFLYLGSINNLIDRDIIINLLKKIQINRKVTLHIVGDGEKRNLFLHELDSAGLTYEYHGKIYNELEKKRIFSKCHFALNVMKSDVKVGLTMKSIDYFQHGLPIINTIQGDTKNLVINSKIGINLNREILDKSVSDIINISVDELLQMKNNTNDVYEKYFSETAFRRKLDDILMKTE